MQRYTLIVVGPSELVTAEIRSAWGEAGVDLRGPIPPESLQSAPLEGVDGALIDITSGDDADLFEFSERLMMAAIPFLYVVEGDRNAQGYRVFLLNARKDDIGETLTHLFKDGDTGVRH